MATDNFMASLKADYGFAPKTITPANLGLKTKQVLKAAFSETMNANDKPMYRKPDYFTEFMLKLAIQGMINRSGPLIYLDQTKWGWSGGDATWYSYYASPHGYTFIPLTGDTPALLQKTASLFNGIILYDPVPSDNIFLAMNLASLNFCLPVSRDLYQQYQSIFTGLPIVVDIEQDVATRSMIYDWMIANVLPRSNRTMAWMAAADFDDNIVNGGGNLQFLLSGDYPFYRKGLLYNITSYASSPGTAYLKPWIKINGNPQDAARFAAIMNGLTRPATIFGWCTGEAEFTPWGHVQCNSAVAPNLSFHGAIKPINPPPYTQDTKTRRRIPENKVYISFASNEGDAIIVNNQLYYTAWKDPGRGKVPLNWAINPLYAKLFPAMIEYFFRTRTANDYFLCAPSGAGYVHPDFMSPEILQGFVGQTAEAKQTCYNFREIILWEAGKSATWEAFAKIPGLRGLTAKPVMGTPDRGQIISTSLRKVPVFCEGGGHYWMDQSRFASPAYTVNVPAVINFLNTVVYPQSNGETPYYFMFYGLLANLPTEITKIDAALDHSKFEIVDMGTMMHMAGLPKDVVDWSPSLLGQAGVWQSLNGGGITNDAGGLRVTVGSGKTWEVANRPSVLLPDNALSLNLRVRAISPGARWVLKLSGDWDQTGSMMDLLPFGLKDQSGAFQQPLDPRVLVDIDRLALGSLQLGLEGPAGSYVIFDSLEFPNTVQSQVENWRQYN